MLKRMLFHTLTPCPFLLPPCRWFEDKWVLDMDGLEEEAVDADGWFYALDFNFLKWVLPGESGWAEEGADKRRQE